MGDPEQEERLTADCGSDQLRRHLEPVRKVSDPFLEELPRQRGDTSFLLPLGQVKGRAPGPQPGEASPAFLDK